MELFKAGIHSKRTTLQSSGGIENNLFGEFHGFILHFVV
jgi:hypothetical protein